MSKILHLPIIPCAWYVHISSARRGRWFHAQYIKERVRAAAAARGQNEWMNERSEKHSEESGELWWGMKVAFDGGGGFFWADFISFTAACCCWLRSRNVPWCNYDFLLVCFISFVPYLMLAVLLSRDAKIPNFSSLMWVVKVSVDSSTTHLVIFVWENDEITEKQLLRRNSKVLLLQQKFITFWFTLEHHQKRWEKVGCFSRKKKRWILKKRKNRILAQTQEAESYDLCWQLTHKKKREYCRALACITYNEPSFEARSCVGFELAHHMFVLDAKGRGKNVIRGRTGEAKKGREGCETGST